jgi:acyl-CoA reductase-like NAD-dependent aldehyde dehydrogenase
MTIHASIEGRPGAWAREVRRAQPDAAAPEAGAVRGNSDNPLAPAAPGGGVERSGSGRDTGTAGIETSLHAKTVRVTYG